MVTSEQETLIKDFLTTQEGKMLLITDDQVLTRAMRNAITRALAIDTDSFLVFSNPNTAINSLEKHYNSGNPCLIFMDRIVSGSISTDFIIRIRRLYPEARLIVIVPQMTKDLVSYYYEIGVTHLICKPISTDILIDRLTRALTPPDRVHTEIQKFKRLIAQGDADEALDLIDAELKKSPENELLLTMRGDALIALGDMDEAVKAYLEAHENDHYYLEPLKRLSAIFRHMDDEKALAYLKKMDLLSPLNAERKVEIAQTHLRRNEQEEAKTYLDKSIEVMAQETEGQLGTLLEKIVDTLERESPDLAGGYIQKILKSPKAFTVADVTTFNRLGIILRNQGKWQEAVETYKKAIDLDSSDPIPIYNMGLAYYQGGKHDETAKCFQRALRLDPNFYEGNEGVAYNIGKVFLKLGDYESAEPFFTHVLEVNPGNDKAIKKMSQLTSLRQRNA